MTHGHKTILNMMLTFVGAKVTTENTLITRSLVVLGMCLWGLTLHGLASESDSSPPLVSVPEAVAQSEEEMQPYAERLAGTSVKFDMVPIPGGTFQMGSPETEEGREDDEGPVHEVKISPFWMGKHEVTWDSYEIFMLSLDTERRELTGKPATKFDKLADAVARPTKPYTDMTFGMGKSGFPAISMTQTAAKRYCEWVSARTGRYYRLPTEAEWEYACRAGSQTAYHFGDDVDQLREYAWFYDPDEDLPGYHKVGQLKPNAFGLHDMHGNVAEWVLDQYVPNYDAFAGKTVEDPFVEAATIYPRSVRGGSWDDDPEWLRSAARRGSTNDWKRQDPQLPQSIWYFTDAQFLGLRVVRPLTPPSQEERTSYGIDEAQRTQPRE